jgi:hypothetical protein
MSSSDENQVYKDLKGFLMADRADLRLEATKAVLHIRDREGMEKIIQLGMVELLAKNTSHPDQPVSHNALQALVHLSSHGETANQCDLDLVEAGGMNRMIEIALSRQPEKDVVLWNAQVNLAMALLANMTRMEAGAVEVAGKTMPDEAIPSEQLVGTDDIPIKPTLQLLLARFLNPHFIDTTTDYNGLLLQDTANPDGAVDSHSGDPYQHMAAVLQNSTQCEAGRRFVMRIIAPSSSSSSISYGAGSGETSVLQKLLPSLKSPNPLRRRGIAGVVRNCCLDRDSCWWLVHVVKVVKHLLYPLAGTW